MSPKKGSTIGAVFSFLLVLLVIYFMAKNVHTTEKIIKRSGVAAPVVAITLYGLFSLTPVTTDPLTVVSGILFGPLLGMFVSWLGNNLASMIEYFVGRHLSKVANFEKTKEKLPFGLGKLPVSSPYFLTLGRFIPGYGGKVVSLMGGMYNVPLKTYVWTTFLTKLLGSVLISYGGYNLIHFIKNLDIL